MKLTDLIQGKAKLKLYESVDDPTIDRDTFIESLRKFSTFNEVIYNGRGLKEIISEVSDLVSQAEQITLKETDQWFDGITVNRHLKQIKESSKLFEKTATEMVQLQQRLESCYEDIQTGIGKYWDINKD